WRPGDLTGFDAFALRGSTIWTMKLAGAFPRDPWLLLGVDGTDGRWREETDYEYATASVPLGGFTTLDGDCTTAPQPATGTMPPTSYDAYDPVCRTDGFSYTKSITNRH